MGRHTLLVEHSYRINKDKFIKVSNLFGFYDVSRNLAQNRPKSTMRFFKLALTNKWNGIINERAYPHRMQRNLNAVLPPQCSPLAWCIQSIINTSLIRSLKMLSDQTDKNCGPLHIYYSFTLLFPILCSQSATLFLAPPL